MVPDTQDPIETSYSQENVPAKYSIFDVGGYVNVQDPYSKVGRFGWKFYLAINPDDIPRAFDIVGSVYENYKNAHLNMKVVRSQKLNRLDGYQGERAIVFYIGCEELNENKEMIDKNVLQSFLQEVETKLVEGQVAPIDVKSLRLGIERKVPGSKYSYYRNDFNFTYYTRFKEAVEERRELVIKSEKLGVTQEQVKAMLGVRYDRLYNPFTEISDPFQDVQLATDKLDNSSDLQRTDTIEIRFDDTLEMQEYAASQNASASPVYSQTQRL